MKKVKLLSLSLLISLSFASGAFASNPSEIIAKFTHFNFKVNEQTKTLTDEPIEINGKSYLPVRAMSQMLGYNVNYDANTMTIELTNQQKTAAANQITTQVTQYPNTNSIKETTFNGMTAIQINDVMHFKLKDYNAKLDLISSDKMNPENTIKYDIPNKVITIIYKGAKTIINFSGTSDNNVYIYNGETYLNTKYYQGL